MPIQPSHLYPQPPFSAWKICRLLLAAGLLLSAALRPACAQDRDFEPLQRQIKVLSTNLHGFGIPFAVSAKNGQFIEVQLYLSTDQGKTWSFHSRQPTSEKEFPFSAEGDGEYWFAIKTLDRNRRLLPDGDVRPQLKIIVDTKKPSLDFRIESDAAGRVACRWEVSDSDLNLDSFRIQYRAGATSNSSKVDTPWKTVPVELAASIRNQTWSDQLAWWPDTAEQNLQVRIQIADKAGNQASESRYVATQPTSWRRRSSGSTLQDVKSPFAPASQDLSDSNWQPKFQPVVEQDQSRVVASQQKQLPPPPSRPAPNRWRINETAAGSGPPVIPGRSAGVEVTGPPIPVGYQSAPAIANSRPQPRFSQGGSVEWESKVQKRESTERAYSSTTMSPVAAVAPIAETMPRRPTDSIVSNPSTRVRSGKNLVTESTTSWPNNQWNGPTEPKVNPQSELTPNVNRMVAIGRNTGSPQRPSNDFNNASFRRLPKIEKASSPTRRQSSVLENRSAAKMPESANTQIISTKRFRLNYDIDAIDPSGVGRIDLWMTRDRGRNWKIWGQDPDNVSPFPVEVSEEGIYGFRIVVRSKDGLAGRGPMQGEEADMWIQVDVSAPQVKITSVPYGRGREVGQLVVNYAVSDSNLSLRPNTLSWSTHPDGPWTVVEKDLRNEGRYVWKPTQNVPHRIFLKVEAIDRAGNVGVHLLEKAIDLSGLTPRGTIFGVDPVGQ